MQTPYSFYGRFYLQTTKEAKEFIRKLRARHGAKMEITSTHILYEKLYPGAGKRKRGLNRVEIIQWYTITNNVLESFLLLTSGGDEKQKIPYEFILLAVSSDPRSPELQKLVKEKNIVFEDN